MVPFWDLPGHINDLTSKKNPHMAWELDCEAYLGNSPERFDL
jgi:hypothetical protein